MMIVFSLITLPNQNKIDFRREKTASIPYSMVIENVELVHKYCLLQLSMQTRMKKTEKQRKRVRI